MINFINRALEGVRGKREEVDPNKISLGICDHINKIVNNYYKERDFKFVAWDDKYIERRLEMYFEENSLNKFIKNLSFRVDEENEIITVLIDFAYDEFQHEYEMNFEVDTIRSLFKELDIVTYEKDGSIRYAGELECCIRRGEKGDLDSIEFFDNRYESNMAKAKVYYTGEMKNGVPHGKGELHWKDGKLLYEGEFQDGKVTGHGKAYFLSGGISAVGYRVDGILQGDVTTYFENGQVEFKGMYKNGLPHGYGSAFDSDGSIGYAGEWEDGWPVND